MPRPFRRPGWGRLLACLLSLLNSGPALAADVFAEMVRSTPWLSPEEARKTFSVPDGFEVQLVAAEPEIGKPISMSFDVDGRLWIAETTTYPVESARDKTPRDVIRILSQFDANGRARRNQVFADGLNTPDAVAPYQQGVIAFTIPNVVSLQDTDGDGKADRRDVLFGPFNARDTHNLANNFRRGFDGWFYGGQGVGNPSAVKGTDGQVVRMSGATFRFRADGSHIERVGDGQANVFGLCFDPLGNLFTSDCHSMPIYQVIHGGFYPVFGKPHDGLGYAPQMLWHNHGSTAIAGLVECHEPLWPAEYQGNFFLGNVVTSRVNRDRIEERGSTKIAQEMPDLVSSSDPWFRPVDVQFGPDGALYIADFYNRIIAHVEIPLDHPGRDRQSGRIWRVVRRGADGQPRLRPRKEFRTLTLEEQVHQLGDPSFSHRLTVMNHLIDQGKGDVIAAVRRAAQPSTADIHLQAAALWIQERLGALAYEELKKAAQAPDRLLRTHALRILVERPSWSPAERQIAFTALHDADGFVARAAADGLARHPDPWNFPPLLALRQNIPEADTHLVYQVRKALRDQLLVPGNFARLREMPLREVDVRAVADVCLAVPSPEAAAFLADFLRRYPATGTPLTDWVRHIARQGDANSLDALADSFQTNALHDLDAQTALFQAMQQGQEQRALAIGKAMQAWGNTLATRLLQPSNPPNPGRQKAAAELAGRLNLAHLDGPLTSVYQAPTSDPELRSACLQTMLRLNAPGHRGDALSFLMDASLPLERRSDIVQRLAQQNAPEDRALLIQVLRQAPEQFAIRIATALCGTPEGAASVLQVVEAGQAPAELLALRSVKDRLVAVRPGDTERIARLTAAIAPDAAARQKLAQERAASFRQTGSAASREAGARIFQLQCAVCHSLNGSGGNVGPQLDGIGHRGVERLCEDVLNPNRNVDKIFRYSIVTLKNGDVTTGLFRREEGALLILVDATGKEVPVAKADVAGRQESETSLMPENFAELLSPPDFQSLLAFLLTRREGKPQ